ncbi:MAG: hypothetical protein ACXVPM_19715 [Bacteroidia bacterium]
MNAMIIFPFIIPALVFTLLIAMLVKERNAFIPKTNRHGSTPDQKDLRNNERKENKNDVEPSNNHWDLSGGALGI